MTTTKKKKSAREKRVLVASIICAGLIVAGSTFAWFTSKDEVTNRLSASAEYNVTIAEDFTPPENWVPGQTVEKNVSVTNTGNVDAFVRTWIQGEMRVVKEDTTGAGLTDADAAVDAKEDAYINLGFKKYNETSKKYLRTLSTVPNENPDDSTNALSTNTKAYSEVMAMQAGGFLAYAPSQAEYKYTLNQEAVVDNYYDGTKTISKTLTAGTEVEVVKTETADKVTAQTYDGSTTHFKGVNVDSDTFKPKTTGLYLFRRVIDQGAASANDKYEYSGYYYVAPSENPDYGNGTYYALQTGVKTATGASADTNVSDYTVPTSQVVVTLDSQSGLVDYITPSCKLMTVTETRVENGDLTWKYTAGDGGKATMTATYKNGTNEDSSDDIVIEVALVNIGARTTGLVKDDNTKGDSEIWQALGTDAADGSTTFYYKNDVEAGDTTSRLIDNVKLADTTTQKAYLAFDFDLNVFLESVQVTMDEAGVEQITPATEQFANATQVSSTVVNTQIVASKVEAKNTDAEITSIEWNKTGN